MESLLDFIFVFAVTILAGGWATGVGVALGVSPLVVWAASTIGSIAFTVAVLFWLGPWRDRAIDRWFPNAERQLAASNAGRLVDRWGAGGLAVGSIAIGPSMTLVGVLLLGVDRVRFLTWYVPLTVVGFGVMTAFWVAIGL